MKKETKKKRIAIIGHFGGEHVFNDGQTVKTKILYEELVKTGLYDITCVDTYLKRNHPMKLAFSTLVALFQNKDIIVLLSGNGMRLYFPVLSFFAKIFSKNIYHDVIGGNLDSYVRKYPRFKSYLMSFKVNWVETEVLRKRLVDVGVINCEVIPNFKNLKIISVLPMSSSNEPYKFCTFSRVMEEKGIEDAIKAVQAVNEKGIDCTLDIYGTVDPGYTDRFEKVMEASPDYIAYKGVVPYSESVDAIKYYYALLFPTYWYGEGFPGTLVDAFSAGLPVICTDWSSNSEIVKNNYNGIVYTGDYKELKNAIVSLIRKKDQIAEIKQNCIETAYRYQPDEYIRRINYWIASN